MVMLQEIEILNDRRPEGGIPIPGFYHAVNG